jgi:hypothetical protein
MSGQLNITFAPDMPTASVEVVGPDLHVVDRVMLSAGKTRTVDVPSEKSFLRVYLPSGLVATLQDPGQLNRVISLDSLRRRGGRVDVPQANAPSPPPAPPPTAPSAPPATAPVTSRASAPASASAPPAAAPPASPVQNVQSVLPEQAQRQEATGARDAIPGASGSGAPAALEGDESEDEDLPDRLTITDHYLVHHQNAQPAALETVTDPIPLGHYGTAQLTRLDGTPVPGASLGSRREAQWDLYGARDIPPFVLQIERPSGTVFDVRVPGSARRVWVRADNARGEGALTFSVRLTTAEPTADTISGYLQRGDLYSAQSMTDWVDEARDMVLSKQRDPYAAAVGGYLLLRLKRFDVMRDWARNLADWFDFMSDGCVIWAWQLAAQDPKRKSEIEAYLLAAAARGLPVFSEGARMLVDGLLLLGETGRAARLDLLERAGAIVRDSPVTAVVRARESYAKDAEQDPVVYDVAFGGNA